MNSILKTSYKAFLTSLTYSFSSKTIFKKLFLLTGIAFLFFAPCLVQAQEEVKDTIRQIQKPEADPVVGDEARGDSIISPEKPGNSILNQKRSSGKKIEGDTIEASRKDSVRPRSPGRAALMSAALPGLGQIYNKKYWKVPVIYAGLIGCGYFISQNQKVYNMYREEFVHRVTNGDQARLFRDNSYYSQQISRTQTRDLPTVADAYRKNRDLLAIGTLAFYLLNVVDASVDAHLFSFDVSEDLSFKAAPDLNYCFDTGRSVPSLSLKLKF